jgi:hypothetical protein
MPFDPMYTIFYRVGPWAIVDVDNHLVPLEIVEAIVSNNNQDVDQLLLVRL